MKTDISTQNTSKIIINVILIMITLYAGSVNSIAQKWQSLNGPNESDIRDFIIKDDTVYVVSWESGGLFKRTLNTNQWVYSEIAGGEGAFSQKLVGGLSIEIGEDGNYFIGGGGVVTIGDRQAYGHFYTSNDYGNSWSEFRNGIESCDTVKDILYDTNNDLFVGCSSGVFKFFDSDNEFIRIGNKFSTNVIYEKNEFLISGSSVGAEYSTNSDTTWNNTGPDSLNVQAISRYNEQFLFGTDHGLFLADSLTAEWVKFDTVEFPPIFSLLTLNNQVIIGTGSGTHLLNENLSSEPIFPQLINHKIQAINAHDNDIFIGTNQGLYKCDLNNDECEMDGVPNSTVKSFYQKKDTALINTVNKVYRYFTAQEQWDSLSISGSLDHAIQDGKDSIYAVKFRHFYQCSFASQGCDSVRVEEPGNALLNLVRSENSLFTSSTRRVHQSTDSGNSWSTIYETSPRSVFGLTTFSDSLLFISGSPNLKFSIDSQSFDTLSKSVALVTKDGTLFSASEGIHISYDFGETWEEILKPDDFLPDGFTLEILFDENNGKLYVVTTTGRVYVTENDGFSWGVNEEMYPIYIESASIGNDGTLYLGTGKAGVFVNTQPLSPPITISNEGDANTQPRSFKILPNYPNPFNPSTTISFELNTAKKVNLSVFDILGQKITSLNLGLKQSGIQNFKLDLSNYSSGIYIVRIKAGEKIRSQKITLIK